MTDVIEKMDLVFWFPPESHSKHNMQAAARVLIEDMRKWAGETNLVVKGVLGAVIARDTHGEFRKVLDAYLKDRGIE